MAAESSHGLVVSGAGLTTTAVKTIGSITLPTRAQPWKISEFTGQVVRSIAEAAEMVGGFMSLDAPNGDITPDPAPSRFPLYCNGSFLGGTAPQTTCPIQRFAMDLDAAGKAAINLQYAQDIALNASPIVNIGIHFGPAAVVPRPFKFCERVRTTVTNAVETQVGTIALSAKATRITGIMGSLFQDGVLVDGQELTGFFTLKSDDVDLRPSDWLFNQVFGAGDSTLIAGGEVMPAMPHMVDIPVPESADIDVFVTLTQLVTNGANVNISIMYE